MKFKIIIAAGAVVCLAVSAFAIERAAILSHDGNARDAQETLQITTLSSFVKALGAQVTQVTEEVTKFGDRFEEFFTETTNRNDAYDACTAQDKRYAPTHAEADEKGCVGSSSSGVVTVYRCPNDAEVRGYSPSASNPYYEANAWLRNRTYMAPLDCNGQLSVHKNCQQRWSRGESSGAWVWRCIEVGKLGE